MASKDSNSSDNLQSETVLQAQVVFAPDDLNNQKDHALPNGTEDNFYPIESDPEQDKGKVVSDRPLFMTLYAILFLAITGLGFSVTRYVQVKRNVRSSQSSQEIASDNNTLSATAEDTDLDRDPVAYRSDIEYILSSEIYQDSTISFLQGSQKKAIVWLVYEDRVLSTTKIREMVDYMKSNNTGNDDVVPTFPLVQRYAMMVLFFETNGELWSERSWAESTNLNECKFVGVECDMEDRVVVLDLALRKLRGRLPEEVGLLTRLESASFLSNSLEGTIPSFIFNKLTNLHSLDLSGNDFSSTISSDISKLTNLRRLHLNELSLTGELPVDAMKSLSNLEQLAMTHATRMNGPLLEYSISWPNLTSIDIYQSHFSGTIPTTVGVNTKLERFWLPGTKMDLSSIPTEIGLLTNLLQFSLVSEMHRMDTGTLPTEIGNCRALQYLQMVGSNYHGTIPTEFGRLKNLTEIYLNRGMLTGSVPSEIGQLTNLQSLDISRNQLQGTLPIELGTLQDLKSFEVYRNNLSGTIPSNICNSPYISIIRDCAVDKCKCCHLPCIVNNNYNSKKGQDRM
mmetsp:Transcript_16575/g.38299  ORF Transcript_16575/g.38299 Transcript_16575/m.38299 type:complete len:567 (+) Transcript_16575:117-1817(+)